MNRPILLLGVTAVFLTGVLAGVLIARTNMVSGVVGSSPTDKIDRVISLIERVYIEPPSDDELVDSAIRGMTGVLDPYSIYVDKRHLPAIREEIDGNFGGVGLWFEMVGDTARVVSVVAGGPGDRAGILPGDRIIAIDDSTAVGVPSLVVQDKIKGPKGKQVRLTLLRPTLRKQIAVEIVRDIIPINSVVSSFMLTDSTAYIRLARFTSSTADEFRSAVEQLREADPQRLIIDLRDNPGGLLSAAVQLADELLPSGMDIVSTEGRAHGEQQLFSSSAGGVAEHLPLIVIVNENSASASEIVAGAVQDNDRGLIVGRPTFGKGLVQSQFLFNDGSALHLTVARYHTPTGRPIQNVGMQRSASPHDTSTRTTPDSLSEYTTLHGRTIKGGQGIYPDEIIDPAASAGDRFFRFAFQSGMDLSFMRAWFDENETALRQRWGSRQDEFVRSYSVPESVWRSFNEYLKREAPVGYAQFSADEVARGKLRVRTLLKGRLGQALYGPSGWLPIISSVDPDIIVADRLWSRAEALKWDDSGGE